MKPTLLAAVLIAAWAAPAVAAPPDSDPFYGVPAGIQGLKNGTVIDSRKVTVTQLSMPIDANAWQVRFKTQDNTGAPTAYITTVIVPRTPWTGKGPRPVLSYQMPEDGVGLKCAPSYVLTAGLAAPSNTTPDATTVATALGRGWTVIVPDYEGPQSMWLGAMGQARGVLDSLRAARAFKPAGIDPRAPIGLWGYSGGAIASSTAAQLQPSYAPKLKLAGVALGGNNASIRAGLQAFDGSPFGGAIVIGFIGLDRAYPQYHLSDYLNATGRAAVAHSQEDCIGDAVIKHPLFRASYALKDPAALDDPVWSQVFARGSPLTFPGTPETPIYDYHATGDELAPIGPDRQLIERYCRSGVITQHVEDQGDHFTEVGLGEPGALQFLADRFAGLPAQSTCAATGARTAPLLKLILASTRLHVDRHGRVVLHLRNPNHFAVTMVAASLRLRHTRGQLIHRPGASVIGAGRKRTLGLTLRRRKIAASGHPRSLSAILQLVARAPDRKTATTRSPVVLEIPG